MRPERPQSNLLAPRSPLPAPRSSLPAPCSPLPAPRSLLRATCRPSIFLATIWKQSVFDNPPYRPSPACTSPNPVGSAPAATPVRTFLQPLPHPKPSPTQAPLTLCPVGNPPTPSDQRAKTPLTREPQTGHRPAQPCERSGDAKTPGYRSQP